MDIQALADVLARTGKPKLAEIDEAIRICEARLEWMRLMRAMITRDQVPEIVTMPPLSPVPSQVTVVEQPRPESEKPAVPEPEKPKRTRSKNGETLAKILNHMNGEWTTVRKLSDAIGLSYGAVVSCLNSHRHLFEKREDGVHPQLRVPLYVFRKKREDEVLEA